MLVGVWLESAGRPDLTRPGYDGYGDEIAQGKPRRFERLTKQLDGILAALDVVPRVNNINVERVGEVEAQPQVGGVKPVVVVEEGNPFRRDPIECPVTGDGRAVPVDVFDTLDVRVPRVVLPRDADKRPVQQSGTTPWGDGGYDHRDVRPHCKARLTPSVRVT